jgi:hypothetical protein
MAAPMKHAELVDEVKALGDLVKDVTQRSIETRREVAGIENRLSTVESGMRSLDDTVSGMRPMLKTNTDLTATTARDVVEIKRVVDRIGPGIDTLTTMVSMQQDRDAARRWWGRVLKFCKSTAGAITITGSAAATLFGGAWWVWTHFKAMP